MVSPRKRPSTAAELNHFRRQGEPDRMQTKTRTPRPKQVLNRYRFFLDLKNLEGPLVKQLMKDIVCVGGEIEPFFSKEISVVITDASEERIKAANLGSTLAPSPTTSLGTKSPLNQSVWSPLSVQDHHRQKFVAKSRIDTILEKAKEKQKAERFDVLETAAKHGIKIWALAKVLAWLENLKGRLQATQRKRPLHQPASSEPVLEDGFERELKAPFIKYEAENQTSRPVIYEFRKFPKVYCGGRAGQSPFVAPIEVIETRLVYEKEATVKNLVKKARSAKPALPQGGYCEICEAPFSELEEHIISKVHIAKVGLSDLWKNLDSCIDSINQVEEEEEFEAVACSDL